MNNNLIHGINPLIISSIGWQRFYRYGTHPCKLKYLEKKNPVRGFFGAYDESLCCFGYVKASVEIYGADGKTLSRITCRSNGRAKQLCKELNEQLNDFLSNLIGSK